MRKLLGFLCLVWFPLNDLKPGTDPLAEYQKFNFPRRDFSIISTPEGYYPDRVIVFKGEKIRFFLTSVTNEPACFLVKDHAVFLSAIRGKVSEGQVVFTKAGEYDFYCPGKKFRGKVVVLGKKDQFEQVKRVKNQNRTLSSKPGKEAWVPKEY